MASLFTHEFYARVKRQLQPGGIFVQWLQVYEFNDDLLATILRAIDAEFGDYAVFATNDFDLVILASNQLLPERMREDVVRWQGMTDIGDRLRLRSVEELEARHLIAGRAVRRMLPMFGPGMNSDYFPLVDQRAPKARFRGETAGAMMPIATAPVPIVEMLAGTRFVEPPARDAPIAASPRRALIGMAQATAAHVLTGAPASDAAPPLSGRVRLARAVLWDCASLPHGTDIAEVLLEVASVINPFSTRERADTLWKAVRTAPCASSMTAADARWIDLFDAVGARDAKRMASLGAQLVEATTASDAMRQYALMAAAIGLIADGNAPAAQRLLNATAERLPKRLRQDAPMRLLALLAA